MSRSRRGNRRRSVVAIWVAITGLLLIGFTGLALDTAFIKLAGQQLQNAADAASLAGAINLRAGVTDARTAAVQIALANKATKQPVQLSQNLENAPDGDIVIGRYDRTEHTFTLNEEAPNAVKVVARRTSASDGGSVPLFYGPIFGVTQADVSRSATAVIQGTTGAGWVTLCPDCECALEFGGTTDLTLTSTPGWEGDSAIQVNSDHECAMCGSGSSLHVQAPETNIVGDACWDGNPVLDTYINPNSPAIPDPLAGLPPPPYGLPDLGTIDNNTGSGTYPPGYYSGGIHITSSVVDIVLQPGIYVVDAIGGGGDSGLYVHGGTLTALEVMFYVIGEGEVNLAGNAVITITPSSDENDPYWGISIFQARDNTNPATIIGSNTMLLEGTYYFPVAPLEIGGTGIALGNQMIAWTVWIHGTGEFTIAYDGRFPVPGARVFLVE